MNSFPQLLPEGDKGQGQQKEVPVGCIIAARVGMSATEKMR
jgi:hypothetical protein